jgi:hypothetical protein
LAMQTIKGFLDKKFPLVVSFGTRARHNLTD